MGADVARWRAHRLPPGVPGTVLLYASDRRLLGWIRSHSGLIWEALVVPAQVPGGILNVYCGGELIGVYQKGALAQKAVEERFALSG